MSLEYISRMMKTMTCIAKTLMLISVYGFFCHREYNSCNIGCERIILCHRLTLSSTGINDLEDY